LVTKTGLTKAQATDAVNAIFDTAPGKGIIAVELDAGRSVTIPGFGTLVGRLGGVKGQKGAQGVDASGTPDNHRNF
jgi:hypothetical protein